MNRAGPSEFHQCCCGSQGRNIASSRYPGVREEYGVNENLISHCGVRRYPGSANVQAGGSPIDDQTLNVISSFRQKACRFLQSESESSGSAPSCQIPNVNQFRGSNVLRQANDLIDYVPQSEFLRKMKQQCQYLQNNQPNIFSTLDNCQEFNPHECQRCIERAKMILNLGDQIGCNKCNQSSGQSEETSQSSSSNHPCRKNNFEGNQMNLRDSKNFCQRDGLYDNQRLPRDPGILPKDTLDKMAENLNERLLQKSTTCVRDLGGNEKKSVHISRSKKPTKCRGRRKRKPDSSEKCEAEEEFQPNLKKPHENSCERCWRYASPLRSPVNKPEQRYDPNFRRGHSCADLNQERGDGDLEIAGKRISPCKNLQPITNREKTSPQTQPTLQKPEVFPQKTQFSSQKNQSNRQAAQFGPQKTQTIPQQPQNQEIQNSSFTKVKELMYNYSQSKSPEKTLVKSQHCECGKRSGISQGILQSEMIRKVRPRSCTTGESERDLDVPRSSFLEQPDYYDRFSKPEKGSNQNEAKKKSVRGLSVNTSVGEHRKNVYVRPATAGTPLKAFTPNMSNRSGPTPRGSSTPKKHYKTSPSPEYFHAEPSSLILPQPKEHRSDSSKAGSPKTPMNLNLSKLETPGSDSTVYNEICTKNNDDSWSPKKSPPGQLEKSSRKSPSPKSKLRNGKSPRKNVKTTPTGSPKRIHSSSDFIENLSPIPEERPQTVFERDFENDLLYGRKDEQYVDPHPVKECCCPPRVPFTRNVTNNRDPDHLLCCHCKWETNLRNEAQRNQNCSGFQTNPAPIERPIFRCNEGNVREFINDQMCGAPDRRRNSSFGSSFQKKTNAFDRAEDSMECPYLSFQREKRAANDKSWEADYQNLKEYCLKNPGQGQFNCQVTTKMDTPFKTSENFPTKYALFYMTQNKRDKGDDVEVLVEELTQACPKRADSRTQDITDKMKRIMECPPDSMALRFQKGVSESCKAPHSSRILYF